ncbi:hypothetical protein LCGC14_1107450 [marine sediment metagenome]|uniref:DNA N-6-adenine-methyltransferase (Dam) n=1 Tax=marine sediment metagenome TaxID=412755 RepID=A0A0F9MCF4_9ZZZZ
MNTGFTHESTYNESKEWYTPKYIFDALGIEFDLDPCSPGMAIVPWIPAIQHYTVRDNGLIKKWHGSVWVNPPYGSDTPKWMQRLQQHGNGIALVFSRTDVKWFHSYIPKADAICFIKGRVQFVKESNATQYAKGKYVPCGGCGAGSMLVAYGSSMAGALLKSGLGLTLPVSRNVETFRTTKDFAGGSRRPNENLPHVSKDRQICINEAVRKLKEKKKC